MKRKQKNSKKVLALLLSFLMAASMGAALTACGETDETETDTDSSESTTDEDVVIDEEELISNATFALNPYDSLKPIVTNTTGWSRATNSVASGVASTSDAASGIIDVASDKWEDLTTSGLTGVLAKDLSEEQAAEKWSTMTTKDKLEYYEAWKDNTDNEDRSITDLEFYEAFNIDVDDLPLMEDANENMVDIGNPGLYSDSAKDTRVLMIHNEKKTDNYIGTAQKFTSSSTVTVKAGEVANFSVWVKTSHLVSSSANNKEDTTAYNRGAYIQITHSVGGKTCQPLEVKNINVNEWTKYEFQLYSSSFADSTFSIILGLGQSGGSDKEEYVNGYAFFDDLTCEVSQIPETVNLDGYTQVDLAADKADKTIYANKMDAKKFALDFYGTNNVGGFSEWTDWANGFTAEATTETRASNGQVFSTVDDDLSDDSVKLPEGLNKSLGWEYDITGTYTIKDLANVSGVAEKDALYNATYKKYFENDDFLGNSDEPALLLLSKNGAAYSAKKELTIGVDKYQAYSFYVKTSEMGSFTGAGIRLEFEDKDLNATQAITALDTTTVVEEDSNTDGWQKVYIFISNETGEEQKATLTLSFGLTSGIIDATANSFAPGFAAFAGFEEKDMTEEEFEYANSGTYAKIAILEKPEEESQVDGGFDSVGALDGTVVKTTYANPKNYKGVYNDSAFTGGGEELSVNQLTTAGLLNKQYEAAYADILAALSKDATKTSWNDVVGSRVTQPLVIYNEEAWTGKTYGYIGQSKSIAANTYQTVSLRVKVSAGATANIYLIDTSEENFNSTLSISSKVAYWYDADGNVCIEDPNGEDFNSKTDIAFRLQKNGLYQVNTNWTGSSGLDANAYYANLMAYVDNYDKDTTHLYLDDLATDYDYSDNWKHDGNDRVAFYYYDAATKSAYAYSDKSTKVYDFSVATALTPRQAANDSKDLHVQVSDTNGEWKIVTFYIHTGESAKNYRLEVWNGAREGGNVAADSYVMFDSWSPSDSLTADTWKTIVEEREEATGATVDSFESVFSFYDTAKYFRYDETLDTKSVGNAYETFDPTTATDTIAYLYSDDQAMCTVFADYAVNETAVTKDADDTATEDTEEEEEEENTTNVWLLVSSIAIAAVLVIAIASLVIRKVISVRRKKLGYEPVKKEKNVKAKKQK